MRSSIALAVLASLVAGATMLAPGIGALDIGCVESTDVSSLPAGTSTLVTPPGADVLGWTPECIVIDNGETVTFTQRDAISHGAKTDCFDLGLMSVVSLPSTTLKVDYDAENGILYTEENGLPNVCEGLGIAGEGTLTIDYWCQFHGKQMPGKIVVKL